MVEHRLLIIGTTEQIIRAHKVTLHNHNIFHHIPELDYSDPKGVYPTSNEGVEFRVKGDLSKIADIIKKETPELRLNVKRGWKWVEI